MSISEPDARKPPAQERAVFTSGSTLRHVLIMTSTGSIGLISVFLVDFLSLLYVSRLGDPNLTAGVGYASQILFVVISVNIGLSIAVSALVARHLGGNDRPGAERLSASGLTQVMVIAMIVALPIVIWRTEILTRIGATGAVLDTASMFLLISLPANPLMAGGMALSGILRAVGDAKRSMYITLIGAVVTAILDPILIFGFHMGVMGAAITTVVSRCVWMIVGIWGAVFIHRLIAWPKFKAVMSDLLPIMTIALPVILTNLAAPVANIYTMRIFSEFGSEVIAAFAIIDRVTPVAFGVLFAMSSAVGPIVSQNYGARLFSRVRDTLTNCYAVAGVYVAVTWAILFFGSHAIASIFDAKGETADLVIFFCNWGATAWFFLGCIFTANAAFNNLGYPILSTVFNWGRATIGTIPFVTLGAKIWGPSGGLMGIVAGAAVFGVFAVMTSYWATSRLASRAQPS